MPKKLKLNSSMKTDKTFLPQKMSFIRIGDANAKVGGQEIPEVTASLALHYQMKQGKA